MERQALEHFSKRRHDASTKEGSRAVADYTLPVVVHIIHQNGPENITDAQVQQGIGRLNDAFANINFYGGNDGVDTRIQFCLAKRNPGGNTTTGIERVVSSLTDIDISNDLQLKDLSRWNPNEYVNIWLVRSIEGGGVAGYAYLPSAHGLPMDGIVMLGSIVPDLGGGHSTLVHEMGHYLGLYHTFEGSCANGNCLADGDRVCDTPPDGTTAGPATCTSLINSCTTDSPDLPDINWNYVDYGNRPCRNGYTQGQTDRMHYFIENVRQSLLESKGCADPCTSAITASFSASSTTVDVGAVVNFTNTSANATSAVWTVNGTAFANTLNAGYTFNAVGSYEICLQTGNADPNCSGEFCQTITVTCPVSASFNSSNVYPQPGETVMFTNGSTGANHFTWRVDGTVAGSTANFSYVFPQPGAYEVCLEAGNGLCANEFCQRLFVFNQGGTGECTGTFLRQIGNPSTVEIAHSIVATPEGNFFIGGRSGNRSLLVLVNPVGEVLWARTFDFTPGNDFIRSLLIDSQGFLIGNVRDQFNSATLNYTFRYNYQTNSMLWVRSMPDPAYTRLEGIFEKPGNGNFVLLGLVENPGSSLDNAFIEIDRSNGGLITMKTFDTGSTTDVFYGGTIYQNNFYTAGNQRYGGLDKIRPSVSKLDLSGNEQWTRVYLKDLNANARVYAEDILVQNDTAVVLSWGNQNGDNLLNSTVQLYKTDLGGEVMWAKNYNISGSNTMVARTLLALPNGYILHGTHNNNGGSADFFFIRTDKQGNVIWARSLGATTQDESLYAHYQDGFIYFSGSTDFGSTPGVQDFLFGRMSLDGEISGPGCEFIQTATATASNINSPYDGEQDLAQTTRTYSQIPGSVNSTAVQLPGSDLTDCQCQQFSEGCDTSFLKTYGTPTDEEYGNAIAKVPSALGGGWLIGGGKGDSAMITLLDPLGDIVWTRSFDATPDAADFIWDIDFDSDNNVIGSGQTRDEPNNNIECFAFKYNMVTNTMLWINELDLNDPAREIYHSIFEKTPGGNYVVAGEIDELAGGSGCDGIILELNRNTGANVWQRNYTLGSCETFQRTIVYNGSIYTTGRYNFDGGGTARMRPAISRFDLNGNQLWSRLYLRAVNSATNARLYPSDIVPDNGLVVLAHGDKSGTSTTDVSIFLYKTNDNGILQWAMEYDIPGANTEFTTRLVNLPDGYLCLGNFTQGDQDVFLFKTDKQGQLIWSKSYGSTGTEDARDMVVENGVIYFTGTTDGLGGAVNEDLYFANLNIDGTSSAIDTCNFFFDLNMTAAPFANPYDAQYNLTNLNQNWNQFLRTATMGQTAVQSTVQCFRACMDSCDLVPDAAFENATASCHGDSLTVNLTVCNEGNSELPAGMPLTFYLSNPTTTNATTAGVFTLPAAVNQDECESFPFTIAAPPNASIFIMLNNDGTVPTPFNLNSYVPGTDIEECVFTNNFGSFIHNFTPPILDLGPDTTMCQFGVTVLDAGPGFVSYHWQDGSTEQTLTAWNPGTYWVVATDSCGGAQTDSITISVDPATVLDLGDDLEICAGGSFTFTITGFETYEWLPATYLSCANCPNPTTTPLANVTYTLTATTTNGCISTDTIAVAVLPGFDVTDSLSICQGDTVLLFGNPVSTAGVYSQTFPTSAGCDSTHTYIVSLLPVVESVEDAVICPGDTILVFGMPVFAEGQFSQVYTSQNGCDSIHTISVGLLQTVETQENVFICFGQTANVFGIPTSTAGMYQQTFTGSNGCDSTHIITLTVGNQISITTAAVHVSCFGGTNGSATATASGGNGNFTYIWSNGGTTTTISSLPGGTYGITITDGNGCTATSSVTITQPAELVASASGVNVTCASLGSATVSASGGTTPYNYMWQNGATTAAITGLAAGAYGCTVTDANGCTATASVSITGALAPTVSITIVSPVSAANPNGGALTAQVNGGVSPFTYQWSNSGATASISNLSSGAYIVTVTSTNGCTATASASLYIPGCIGDRIWNDRDRDGCQEGIEPGMANVTVHLSGVDFAGNVVDLITTTGSIGNYRFNGLAPGNYKVVLVAPNGYAFSPANACNDDVNDSDLLATGFSENIHLAEGQCNVSVDGGLYDVCLNISNPGAICCDQILCGPGVDAAPITSAAPATGSPHPVEYMWIYSHGPTPPALNGAWQPVTVNGQPVMTASYDPGPISQTTWFARCARAAGCTEWLETAPVKIEVDDVAVAQINGPDLVCAGDQATYIATANPAGATYQWNFGGWATPAASIQPTVNVTWNSPGIAYISLIVRRNGCTSTEVKGIAISNSPVVCPDTRPAGLGSRSNGEGNIVEQAAAFAVYPNPASDVVKIEWNDAVQTSVSIELRSIEGKLLQQTQTAVETASHLLDLDNIPAGVYLLRLRYNDGETAVFRLIRQ